MQHRVGLAALHRVAQDQPSILVLCSGGKDSLCVLDLCHRAFAEVRVVFGYLVPHLSFQERTLRYLEQRYRLTIHRVPYFGLSHFLADGTYRLYSPTQHRVKKQSATQWIADLRAQFGDTWIASGERWADSLWRRGWLKRVAHDGVAAETRRLYPVIDWSKDEVLRYLDHIRMPLPIDYAWFGHSFGRMSPSELAQLKAHSPDDYAKVLAVFPLAEAAVMREALTHG